MDKLITEFKEALFSLYGTRLKDGKCAFCGNDLSEQKYCDCLKASKINRYYKKTSKKLEDFGCVFDENDFIVLKKSLCQRANVPAKYNGMDFDDYKTDTKERKHVFSIAKGYFDESIKNFLIGKNLILTGNFGTGKTLLMSIISNRLTTDFAFVSRYINAVKLINDIKDSFNENVKISTKKIIDNYCNADFLFIDDIDKLNPTEYVRELMYSVVNTRYEKELPIIVSSNNPIEVLDEKFFGEAIISRLLEKSIEIQFNSKNARFE